jgi:hypothetical protein
VLTGRAGGLWWWSKTMSYSLRIADAHRNLAARDDEPVTVLAHVAFAVNVFKRTHYYPSVLGVTLVAVGDGNEICVVEDIDDPDGDYMEFAKIQFLENYSNEYLKEPKGFHTSHSPYTWLRSDYYCPVTRKVRPSCGWRACDWQEIHDAMTPATKCGEVRYNNGLNGNVWFCPSAVWLYYAKLAKENACRPRLVIKRAEKTVKSCWAATTEYKKVGPWYFAKEKHFTEKTSEVMKLKLWLWGESNHYDAKQDPRKKACRRRVLRGRATAQDIAFFQTMFGAAQVATWLKGNNNHKEKSHERTSDKLLCRN